MASNINPLLGKNQNLTSTNTQPPNISSTFNSISATASKQILAYLNAPTLAGVRLKIKSLKDTQDSDVSEQMVIDNMGLRQRIQDSIAPKIRVWNIQGYILAEEYEFSQYYITSLEQNKTKIENARNSRQPVEFKNKMGEYFNVTIESFITEYDGTIQNALPITLVLKEFVVLSTSVTEISEQMSSEKKQLFKATNQRDDSFWLSVFTDLGAVE